MTTMPEPLQQRLEALEIKAAYADDLLEELNLTIYKQQQQIDRLLHLVNDLQQRMPETGAVAPGARDELPPHY